MKKIRFLVFLVLLGIIVLIGGCKPKERTCGDPIRDGFGDYCVQFQGLCPFVGDSSLILSGQIDPTKIVVYDQDGDTIQHTIEDSCIKINLRRGSISCNKFEAMNRSVNNTFIEYLIIIDYNSQSFTNDTFGLDFEVREHTKECFKGIEYVWVTFYRKVNGNFELVYDGFPFWRHQRYDK